jgi:hypothetical protein
VLQVIRQLLHVIQVSEQESHVIELQVGLQVLPHVAIHVLQVNPHVHPHVYPQVGGQIGSQVAPIVITHGFPVAPKSSPLQHPAIPKASSYPFSAVYMNSFTAVGKKFILLLSCSIRRVYNGVQVVCELAVTAAATKNSAAIPIAVANMCPLFMSFTSCHFYLIGKTRL